MQSPCWLNHLVGVSVLPVYTGALASNPASRSIGVFALATNYSISEIFENLCSVFVPEKAQNDSATIQFNLSGDNGGVYWVKVDKGTCASGTGTEPEKPDMTLNTSAPDWLPVSNGQLNPMTAFMAGEKKNQGSMGLALKLQTWVKLTT